MWLCIFYYFMVFIWPILQTNVYYNEIFGLIKKQIKQAKANQT